MPTDRPMADKAATNQRVEGSEAGCGQREVDEAAGFRPGALQVEEYEVKQPAISPLKRRFALWGGHKAASVSLLRASDPERTRSRPSTVVDGGTLAICNNVPNPKGNRPMASEARGGSGYVPITFTRTGP